MAKRNRHKERIKQIHEGIPDFSNNGPFDDAELKDYISDEEYRSIEKTHNYKKYEDIANQLFFEGGTLEKVNLKIKNPEASRALMQALRVLLRSFAPPHEIKMATVAKLLEKHTEFIR